MRAPSRGLSPHGDEDEVAFELGSVREAETAERSVAPAEDPLDAGPEPEVDAVLSVPVGEEAADLRPELDHPLHGKQQHSGIFNLRH